MSESIVKLSPELAKLGERVYKATHELQEALEALHGTRLGAIVTVSTLAPVTQWPRVSVKLVAPVYQDEV